MPTEKKDGEAILTLLKESLLPENVECDGAMCMGCWKDKVREAIKLLESLGLPISGAGTDECLDAIAKEYSSTYCIIENWNQLERTFSRKDVYEATKKAMILYSQNKKR